MEIQEDFITKIAPFVVSLRKSFGWGVPSAIIGQACLESAYGKSDKAADHNNFFGLKYKPNRVNCNDGYFTASSAEQLPDGSYVMISTNWFNFPDMFSGVKGYFQFVDYPRYSGIKTATDPESYLKILKDGGYATSINYVANVLNIVHKYNLTQYDKVAPMYTNSSLVVYTDLTDHNYGLRTHAIDTITIHHMAGNLSVETCGSLFHRKNGSSNYGIGTDGRIALYVPESNGAWTSSNKTNDMRAITIEVANDICAPYWTISATAMTSLINLCADICRRNNIKGLVWSDNKSDRVNHKNGCNMTLHKDFAATACPGPFLSGPGMMAAIALAVNQQLAGASSYIINGLDYAPVFDPVFYADKYPDVKAAFGSNAGALWNHFRDFGMNEARQGSAEFDPKYYRAHYSDLDKAFADSWPDYYTHYIMFGISEGRTGAP